MKNPIVSRALAVVLSMFFGLALAGCASSKATSNKEYQWQDMSTGKSFFNKPISSSQSSTTPATP